MNLKPLLNISFFILMLSTFSFLAKAEVDDIGEAGLNYLFHSEFLTTLYGDKPVSFLSWGLPREQARDQAVQEALARPLVRHELSRRGVEIHRLTERPEWNPKIELVYYLVINQAAFAAVLNDPLKKKLLDDIEFENSSVHLAKKKFLQMLSTWQKHQGELQANAALGIFLGYPEEAVRSFVSPMNEEENMSKNVTYNYYAGPREEFKLGAFTFPEPNEKIQQEVLRFQQNSFKAVETVVAQQTQGKSFTQILAGWKQSSFSDSSRLRCSAIF